MESNQHYSVLLNESINALKIKPEGKYVDCTLGRAGHSSLILSLLNGGHLYAFDQDATAIDYSNDILNNIGKNFTLIKSNFKNIAEELLMQGIESVDGILMDLGVSSPQLDNPERGFSYHHDAKLDMRMDQSTKISAYDVVNKYEFNKLVWIFSNYGEEKFSKQIARKIEQYRAEKPIETTLELVEIIKSAYPEKAKKGKHPARKVFQAIRIEVNDELGVLRNALDACLKLLSPGGRLAIITFHSLEDRIVKVKFKEVTEVKQLPKGIPMMAKDETMFTLVSRKPILASERELELNKRSRSAKLRIIERKMD